MHAVNNMCDNTIHNYYDNVVSDGKNSAAQNLYDFYAFPIKCIIFWAMAFLKCFQDS